jgi:hypothetical protein
MNMILIWRVHLLGTYIYVNDHVLINQFMTTYCKDPFEQQILSDIPGLWFGFYVTPTQPSLKAFDNIIKHQFPAYSHTIDR